MRSQLSLLAAAAALPVVLSQAAGRYVNDTTVSPLSSSTVGNYSTYHPTNYSTNPYGNFSTLRSSNYSVHWLDSASLPRVTTSTETYLNAVSFVSTENNMQSSSIAPACSVSFVTILVTNTAVNTKATEEASAPILSSTADDGFSFAMDHGTTSWVGNRSPTGTDFSGTQTDLVTWLLTPSPVASELLTTMMVETVVVVETISVVETVFRSTSITDSSAQMSQSLSALPVYDQPTESDSTTTLTKTTSSAKTLTKTWTHHNASAATTSSDEEIVTVSQNRTITIHATRTSPSALFTEIGDYGWNSTASGNASAETLSTLVASKDTGGYEWQSSPAANMTSVTSSRSAPSTTSRSYGWQSTPTANTTSIISSDGGNVTVSDIITQILTTRESYGWQSAPTASTTSIIPSEEENVTVSETNTQILTTVFLSTSASLSTHGSYGLNSTAAANATFPDSSTTEAITSASSTQSLTNSPNSSTVTSSAGSANGTKPAFEWSWYSAYVAPSRKTTPVIALTDSKTTFSFTVSSADPSSFPTLTITDTQGIFYTGLPSKRSNVA